MLSHLARALQDLGRPDLSAQAKVTLLALAATADPSGVARMGMHDLSAATGLSPRSLSLAIRELAAAGLAARRPRGWAVYVARHGSTQVDPQPSGSYPQALSGSVDNLDVSDSGITPLPASTGDLSTVSTDPTTTASTSSSNSNSNGISTVTGKGKQLLVSRMHSKRPDAGTPAALAAHASMRLAEAEALVDRVARRLGWLMTKTRRASQVRAAVELLEAGITAEDIENLACAPGANIRSLWMLHWSATAPRDLSEEAQSRARRILQMVKGGSHGPG